MPFTSGNIAERVVASCSIPLVFRPVKIDGSYCVDGGVLHNLPSFYLRPVCNTVIGINVSPLKLGPIKLNVRSLAYRTYKLMTMRNVVADKQLCDLLVDIISIQGHSTFDTSAANKIAQKGYFETMKILKNSQLIKDLTKWPITSPLFTSSFLDCLPTPVTTACQMAPSSRMAQEKWMISLPLCSTNYVTWAWHMCGILGSCVMQLRHITETSPTAILISWKEMLAHHMP